MNQEQLHDYITRAQADVAEARTPDVLQSVEQRYLGRKSDLAHFSRSLGQLSPEERAEAGRLLNAARQTIEQAIEQQKQVLATLAQPIADLTIPAARPATGTTHLISQTVDEIIAIFSHLGMRTTEAPEVDYDWYAFESLNMPKTHPARDEWETFFVEAPEDEQKGRTVLRPHTTNFEAHVMERYQPPFRFITVGKTYRRQADASHTPMFHQFEGFMVDQDLSIGNLVAMLEFFVHSFFGPDTKTRIRPYHFRFTEPSFELDISCTVCGGTGCKLCKEGWLELGGAGMTHPVVLENGGLDSAQWTGLAWGWGVERCIAIRHGIDDLRVIYDNDVRFLEQF